MDLLIPEDIARAQIFINIILHAQATVSGTVPTSGWSKSGELNEYIYFVPPSDGYYKFDFVATPPSPDIIVTQKIRLILATFILDSIPEGLKGIKVYSSSNSREEPYEDPLTLSMQISRIGSS